eukprot:scaffold2860_cov124-Skeletonema_dohrnii-CCMP3373.AAC.2
MAPDPTPTTTATAAAENGSVRETGQNGASLKVSKVSFSEDLPIHAGENFGENPRLSVSFSEPTLTTQAGDNFQENAGANRRQSLTLTQPQSVGDWRQKKSLTYSMRYTKSHRKLADVDDEEGKAQFFLLLLFQRWEAELQRDHKLYQ